MRVFTTTRWSPASRTFAFTRASHCSRRKGCLLGTLCLIDREPRELSDEEVRTLKDLARIAESELTTSEFNRVLSQLRAGEERLRRAEENYRSIFENVAEGIFQIDCHGNFIKANPAVARIYGYATVEEFTGKVTNFGRASQTDPTRRTALLDDLSSASRVTDFESEIVRGDGSVAWISESIHAIRDVDGTCLYYEGTVHDITGQRYAAAAQAQARDEAVKSAEIKSDFLSTMSHEIRTPMHGIIGMTGLLLNTALQPDQEELVRLIASCGDNLLSLINNALDFSKIEAGCLELDNQPFALRPCLKEVIDLLSVQASNKNLTLACEVDPRIPEVLVSDLTRVRQILFNLISNSMKFTPSGGRVGCCGDRSSARRKGREPRAHRRDRPVDVSFYGARHGGGDSRGKTPPPVPSFQSGGRDHQSQARRDRAGPRDLPSALRDAWRRHLAGERNRHGLELRVYGQSRSSARGGRSAECRCATAARGFGHRGELARSEGADGSKRAPVEDFTRRR